MPNIWCSHLNKFRKKQVTSQARILCPIPSLFSVGQKPIDQNSVPMTEIKICIFQILIKQNLDVPDLLESDKLGNLVRQDHADILVESID